MIIKILKNYKRNKATIELAQIKIKELKLNLKKDAVELNEIYPRKQLEKIGTQKMRPTSPTEKAVERSEFLKEKIKDWIKDERIKIKKCEKEIRIVDILLNTLSEEEKFIVESKYINGGKWNIITYKFNLKFRNSNNDSILTPAIHKKNDAIIKKLDSLI